MSDDLKLPLETGSLEKSGWHYTNATGLLGILETGEIWAASPRFVNDTSEMTYGLDKLREYWGEGKLFDGLTKDDKKFISDALNASEFEIQIDSTFFISTSKNGDNLSQWRNYSGSDGFAIELDLEVDLCHENLVSRKDGLGLLEGLIFSGWYDVSYDENSLIKRFLEIIRGFRQIRLLEELKNTQTKLDFAKVILMSNILKFKHPAFLHEEEIRFVIAANDSVKPKYIESRGLIRPYLNLRTCTKTFAEAKLPLPIKSIKCGPEMKNSEVTMIKEMLSSYGYNEQQVTKSDIPFIDK